jgi:hypothetical protein
MTPQQLQKVYDKERKQLEKLLCTMCQTGVRLSGSRWCGFCTKEAEVEFGGK